MNFKLTNEITVEQFLSDIRAYPDRVFWLAFVRAHGKNAGEVKVVAKCRYGAPGKGLQSSARADGTPRKKSLHVDRGTLPLTDTDSGEYITPLISHIIGFNLKKVIHSCKKEKQPETATSFK